MGGFRVGLGWCKEKGAKGHRTGGTGPGGTESGHGPRASADSRKVESTRKRKIPKDMVQGLGSRRRPARASGEQHHADEAFLPTLVSRSITKSEKREKRQSKQEKREAEKKEKRAQRGDPRRAQKMIFAKELSTEIVTKLRPRKEKWILSP